MKQLLTPILAAAVTAMVMIMPMGANAAMKGGFTGANEHVTTGGVQVVRTADGGAVVILDSDFSLDGAPDPHVGFGRDGEFDVASDLGKLMADTGLQIFVVPASVNVEDYNEVYIWCLEFSVALGVASLN
ncbi:MAG: DM13 domain-containing protein [Albidovulum sp.]|uniref:DM13 domain-containing protein n=1 Tax=Albidovulum sp. TaxID=1872424 RepID=UPI003CC1B4C8